MVSSADNDYSGLLLGLVALWVNNIIILLVAGICIQIEGPASVITMFHLKKRNFTPIHFSLHYVLFYLLKLGISLQVVCLHLLATSDILTCDVYQRGSNTPSSFGLHFRNHITSRCMVHARHHC